MSEITIQNNNNLHKKSERIAAAIFLVSNTIPESEILKTKIRVISLDIVSLSISITDSANSDRFSSIRVLEKKVNELASILDIASISGLISEMNSKIIKNETDNFSIQISELLKTFFTFKGNLSQDFFGQLDKHIEDNKKDNENHLTLVSDNGNTSKVENTVRSARKDQRSKCILDLITKKGTVSIKDISMSIKGCSEKTVQRELTLMIKSGVIEKTGERRWSKYSLKSG